METFRNSYLAGRLMVVVVVMTIMMMMMMTTTTTTTTTTTMKTTTTTTAQVDLKLDVGFQLWSGLVSSKENLSL